MKVSGLPWSDGERRRIRHKHHTITCTSPEEVADRIKQAQAWGFQDFGILVMGEEPHKRWFVFADPEYHEDQGLETAHHMLRATALSIGWLECELDYGDKARSYHIEHCLHHNYEEHTSKDTWELYVWLKEDDSGSPDS